MLYYKVPIVDGQTDCSAGSILCCAYPQDGYMVCKFESVAKVGPQWVEITAEEFEANCPEFPEVPSVPGGSGQMTVTLDLDTETASHSSTEILEHLSGGGSVIAKLSGVMDEYCHLWAAMDGEVGFSYIMVSSSDTTQYLYTVRADKSIGVAELVMKPGSGETVTDDPTVTAIAVTEAADGSVTMVNTLDSGSTETIVITPDASGNPGTLTYNGTAIPITWVVSE